MIRRSIAVGIVLVLLGLGSVAPIVGGDEAPAYTAEQMAAWQKAMTPGQNHKYLEAFVGTWDAHVLNWDSAGQAEPNSSRGTAEFVMVLGGRHLQQKFTSQFMGMDFEGIGYTGYDNTAAHYVSTWVDNLSTGMIVEHGSCDASGKVFHLAGKMVDPMSGEEMGLRSEHRLESADRHVLTMYGSGQAGKEFKMMEIVYTRK